MNSSVVEPDAGLETRRLGPIRLAAGVTPAQIGVFLAVVVSALCIVVFLPLMQAFVVMVLFVLQFLFGMLSTAHIAGTSTTIADYPLNPSRGKFVALMILIQSGVSALVVGYVGARLPSWFVAAGFDAPAAGRFAFLLLAGLGVFAATIALLFLKEPPRKAQLAPARSIGAALRGFLANLGLVYAASRRNPRFGLVMSMGLVIRSDYFVMLSFISLWVVNAATSQGIAATESLKTAGLLLLTFKLATAAAQAIFGFIADRINRSVLLIASLAATGFALVSTLLISNVSSLGMYIVVGLIGVTESALIVCGQSMLGEESPVELRGSATGIFYFFGTLGVVVMSVIAGQLFDKLGYAAPFVMVGLLNLLFAVIGGWLVLRQRGLSPAPPRELAHMD